ncbi:Sensor histidine kinase TmoS [compost metagenome]
MLTCNRSGSDFVFSVSDRGPGIPEDVLKTVFDRFSSRGNGGRRSGAGLGLSIVESFVSLHKGEVHINSKPGEGTVVTCRIPSYVNPHSIAAE